MTALQNEDPDGRTDGHCKLYTKSAINVTVLKTKTAHY